ncbi:hypothetical protein QAD02_008571 [Eretmocerus hayati]|uniref:Uncharacterized protein n=1 Tax=Eretmocerus hayati TaxID=131215 RepID=A0ACC2N6S6_9HYME|nr:hypothetical protein QAD02_008571 [Eretmocerus hayati]
MESDSNQQVHAQRSSLDIVAGDTSEGNEIINTNSKECDDLQTTSTHETITENSIKSSDVEKIPEVLEKASTNEFKKPVLLIGPRKGHPTKVRTISKPELALASSNAEPQSELEPLPECPVPPNNEDKQLPVSESQIDKKLPLPYSEPSWSGKPDGEYKFEVLKSGVILETIDLTSKKYHVVGRLPTCDVPMAHPTISRYHAIIQYKETDDAKNGKGMYIYDLGSTHGTFWNGNRIKPKVYVRLQGGHMIKFGCSQRKFILQAPDEDQEQESEYSVTELKEMRRLELEEREKLEKQRLLQEEEEEKLRKEKEENEGIDWGMGEDADEETDLTENPFAQTNNEELFLDDPKKTLRGWFEREGLDMQYQVEEKGIGKFLCWVDLPIDSAVGQSVRAEVLVSGKKKEAVVQCALEACRVLDRHGLLRQANHEARKKKSRNWEEEDFYDSDDDNFLDRTGTIEKKREHRMRMAGKLEKKAETYDSLIEKHSQVTEKIKKIENLLAQQKANEKEVDDSSEDALDAFMSSLGSSTFDKTEMRRMKIDLINLRKEEMQLLKLINIAKPANLPPLKPYVPNEEKISRKRSEDTKSEVCQKIRKKVPLKVVDDASESSEINLGNDAYKMPSEENPGTEAPEKTRKELMENEEESSSSERVTRELPDAEISCEQENYPENDETPSSDDVYRILEGSDVSTDNLSKKTKKAKKSHHKKEKVVQKSYDGDEFREDYSMWLPPVNQSGDGKTSLNEKFGY